MPTLDVCVSWGTLALTKDGSQKKVKRYGDTGKSISLQEELDMRSHRKLQAEYLK